MAIKASDCITEEASLGLFKCETCIDNVLGKRNDGNLFCFLLPKELPCFTLVAYRMAQGYASAGWGFVALLPDKAGGDPLYLLLSERPPVWKTEKEPDDKTGHVGPISMERISGMDAIMGNQVLKAAIKHWWVIEANGTARKAVNP